MAVSARDSTQEAATAGIPDLIGPVLGWRAWRVDEWCAGVSLVSVTCDYVWSPDGWNVADCWRTGLHVAPAEHCTCGFYSARSRAHLVTTEYPLYSSHARSGWQMQPKLIGEVELAGKVIPAANGFRAMLARPRRILVPHEFHRLVKPLQAAYLGHAKVELANTLLLPIGETPEWCLGCGIRLPRRQLRCPACGDDQEPDD